MKDLQDRLDKGNADMARLIKLADRLRVEAGQAADEFCAAGDAATSARLRSIEGCIRIGTGFLVEGQSKGRELQIEIGGGVIQPQFGGDK